MEELLEHYRKSDERAPEDLREIVQRLGYDLGPLESLPYYENPFELRNWVFHNIGSTNTLLDLRALLLHAELLYLTARAELNQIDITTDARSKEIMKELANMQVRQYTLTNKRTGNHHGATSSRINQNHFPYGDTLPVRFLEPLPERNVAHRILIAVPRRHCE